MHFCTKMQSNIDIKDFSHVTSIFLKNTLNLDLLYFIISSAQILISNNFYYIL